MLEKYLINNFFKGFITLFLILFSLTSIILLITLSNMTYMLKISLSEFLYLYVLTLPEIIFYTLPLTFFITAASSIAKLFENSELITILAIGVKPKKIVKPFFKLSLIFTLFLMIITFFSIPTSQILYKNFINIKKTESQFNFNVSSVGQKLGDWNIFIQKKENKTYKNITLYNNKKMVLITAKKAYLSRKNNYFTLSLEDGILYSKNSKISKIAFKTFKLNQKIKFTPLNFNSISEYIKLYKKKTNRYFLISFFPLISFFFLISISFFHNRYQKNHSIIFSLIIAIIYYGIVFATFKNLYTIFWLFPVAIIIAKILERKVKQF